MSYLYSPSATDTVAVASDAATRVNAITGTPMLPSPAVPAAFQAFLQAVIDNMLCAVGLQIESNNVLSSNTSTNTSFVDLPGSSITFTATIAKTYLVHCDCAIAQTVGVNTTNQLRLVVNGSNGPAIWANTSVLNAQFSFHLMHSAACVAGANTIKLQWAAASGATMAINSNSYANYMVSG